MAFTLNHMIRDEFPHTGHFNDLVFPEGMVAFGVGVGAAAGGGGGGVAAAGAGAVGVVGVAVGLWAM